MTTNRVQVQVRMFPQAIEEIDKIAQELDVSRSHMIRRLLGLGLAEWRKGSR